MFLNSKDGMLCVFGARPTSLCTLRLTLPSSENQKLLVTLNTLDVCQQFVLEDLCFMLSNWSWRTGLDLYCEPSGSHLREDNFRSNRCFKVGELQAGYTFRDYRNPVHFYSKHSFFSQRIYQLKLECAYVECSN
jgi:hypothetical protein